MRLKIIIAGLLTGLIAFAPMAKLLSVLLRL